MTRRIMTLLAPLAVCVAGLGFATSAHAARGMEIALGDDNVFVKGLFSPRVGLGSPFKALNAADQLHTSYVRANVIWTTALGAKQSRARRTPRNITYDWTPWDDLVRRAAAHNIKVELTLVGPAPRWASGNKRTSFPITKPNPNKFAAFARAAAQHFQGDVNVDRFTIWNEPNLDQWLSPSKNAPRIYRNLYSGAYKAIKNVDNSNEVFIGETAPQAKRHRGRVRTIAPLKFLRDVTCVNASYKKRRCSALHTDGYAHHPYDFQHKPTYRYPGKDNVTAGTLSRLTSALSKLKRANALTTPTGGLPYVYLTEYGYFASYKFKLSRKKQAAYLLQGFKIAQKNRRVKQMLQYVLVPPPKKLRFFSTQIMSRSFRPYTAFRVLKKWTDGQAKSGGIATP